MDSRRLLRITLVVVTVLSSAQAHALLPDPEEACSVRKLRAAVVAFSCQLRVQSRLLLGRSADPSRCVEKLSSAFARAEARGGCMLEGDATDAASQVEQAAIGVFDSLGANGGPDEDAKRCIGSKSKAIAQHAKCQSLALAQRILDISEGEASDFTNCATDLEDKFSKIESAGTCSVTGDAETARKSSGAGYGYLAGAPLSYRNFESALLPDANLTGARLYNADLVSADLSNASFEDSVLEVARIESSDARGADFSDASLIGVDLLNTDLSNAIFENANLFGAIVEASDLTGVDLSTANLGLIKTVSLAACPAALPVDWTCRYGVLLGPTANLSGASFPGLDLSGLNLQGSNLDGANLTGADLSNANLAGTRCYSAIFTGANVSGVDMTGSEFRAANFENADVTGAQLNVVEWTNTVCPDGFVAASGGSCCGHHVGGAPAACSP